MPDPNRRAFLGTAAGLLLVAGGGRVLAREGVDPDAWIVHSEVPPNREVPLDRLIEDWITPVDRFYVRSHAASPAIDPAAYRLAVDGLVDRPLSLSLDELAALPQVEVTATMTCAGNRRTEHSRTETIAGVPWQAGAIGNATWSGVRLSDVLAKAGVQDGALHVWFDGLDRIDRKGQTIGFGASIPLPKALDADEPGAVVCTHQNGQPLTADHGYPVRTVVPGYIGARSVKWLGRIRVANRPNPNHYQATAYKIVTEATPLEWAERAAIYRFPLNAVIATPRDGATVAAPLQVAGYALPPGEPGVTIDEIELSTDGGSSWTPAELVGPSQPLCWQLWKATLDTVPESLVLRATDSRGRSQPERTPWNRKGYLYNAQHRIELEN